MQLYLLHRNPVMTSQILLKHLGGGYTHTMLKELCQLISSALISEGVEDDCLYKPVAQGKELQKFILANKAWVFLYGEGFMRAVRHNTKTSWSTLMKYRRILDKLWDSQEEPAKPSGNIFPKEGYFRYSEAYTCEVPSKTLLDIDSCIDQYRKYLEWKISKVTKPQD